MSAAGIDILAGRLTQGRQHATLAQHPYHGDGPLVRGARIAQTFDCVVGNQVHDRVLACQQTGDALDLVVAVVDAVDQGPLVLHRIAGGARIGLGLRHQFIGRNPWCTRQQGFAQVGAGGVQRQGECGPDPLSGQPLEDPGIAHGREHQTLVADAAERAKQVDRLEHIVEVVGRLAHAHEDHLAHRLTSAGSDHLRHDFGAADLSQQALAAGHAEHATHRAAHLRRDADAFTRQQHGLDRLAVGQRHQQSGRTVARRMARADPRDVVERALQGGQGLTKPQRQEVGRLAPAAAQGPGFEPLPKQMHDMGLAGAVAAQLLAHLVDAHCQAAGFAGRKRS